jgi:NADPH:quinone reductase-like Zn-dependent oxidoreductase
LGTDVSGVVEEVGDGVTDISSGDVVYTRVGIYRHAMDKKPYTFPW